LEAIVEAASCGGARAGPCCAKSFPVIAPGSVLSSKYKLLRLLGEGGMGAVYEAEHLVLGTRVAVKILHPDLARREGLMDRFLQEAMVAARIRSENVVHVMDVERTADGVAFMVMELLQGESLADTLGRVRRLEEAAACEYARQILSALEAAHALGVVHRDLKPENVFVTFVGERPVLKLIDFGIAKLKRTEAGAKNLTVAGVLMGTAEYMAPEQAYSADAVDARADVYAVGVMLYEMLAGTRPVSGDDGRLIALKIERGEITPLVRALPGVKPELAGLVHRAMAFRREVRFASATEMRIALESQKNARPGALPTERLSDLAAKASTGTMMGAPLGAVLAAAGKPGLQAAQAAQVSQVSQVSQNVSSNTALESTAPAHRPHAPAASQLPSESAYGSPPAYASLPAEGGTLLGDTNAAQAVAQAHRAPVVGPVPASIARAPSYVGQRAPQKSHGLVIGLVVGSLVLGAGIAGAVVFGTGPSSPTVVVPTFPAPIPPAPGTDTTQPTALTNTPPLVPTLNTPGNPPQAQGPQVPPRPSSSGSPSASPSSSAPPLPSLAFPPMPSTLPSFQIPTAWPSAGGFPPIPGFPGAPGSPVAPQGSAGY
jgi:serine/threonine protein kinase